DRQRHVVKEVVDRHVVVGADGVELVERPVEATGSGVAVDVSVLRHEVVAALDVVVVLAVLADHDLVTGVLLTRLVEERRAVIALEEIVAGAALAPVAAAVAEDGVGARARDDVVIARAGERLVVVDTSVGEVVAVAAEDEVVTRAGVDRVVVVAALEHVSAV